MCMCRGVCVEGPAGLSSPQESRSLAEVSTCSDHEGLCMCQMCKKKRKERKKERNRTRLNIFFFFLDWTRFYFGHKLSSKHPKKVQY